MSAPWVPGLTRRPQPEPSLPDTAALTSLARLKKELRKLDDHLGQLKTQSQTPKLSKVQVDLVTDPKLYDIVTGAPLAARIQQQRKFPEDNSNPVRIQDRDQHPPRNKQYPTGMPASPWFAKPTAPAVFQPGRR
ncbi:hypothetical protein JCM1840_002696 [Sporobolomyces johnsonii]